jgi:signal transduction histidine kinase
MLYRTYGLAQVLIAAMLTWDRFSSLPPMLWFSLAVVAESVAVIAICARLRMIPAPLITFDVAWMLTGLFLAAILSHQPNGTGWVDYMYTYSMITSVALGFAYRRYLTVFALTCLLATGYVVSDMVIQHVALANTVPNTGSYFLNTTVAWTVARYLRRITREFDASRAEALARTEALAKERERARHARILHDRVLQTLETLARGDWVSDPQFRSHIAAEAAWLRALVEGADTEQDGDLLIGLQRLVQHKAKTGLHVDLNTAQLRDSSGWLAGVPPEVAAALVEAAHEALTNVAKHAGVAEAVLRVGVTGHLLTVSILDRGGGFDQAAAHQGIGLKESIRNRLRDVGGTAHVDSSPGGGTYVELTVPLAT